MDEESEESYSHLRGRGRPEHGLLPEQLRRIQQSPEWKAAKGSITAEEYLATFGDHRGPVVTLEFGNTGESKLWKKKRRKRKAGAPCEPTGK